MKQLVVLCVCACAAAAGVKDGVYTNAEKGVRFSADKDGFAVRGKDFKLGITGALAEFEGKDGKSAGVLLRFDKKGTAKEHAKWRGEEFAKNATSCVWEREEKLKREPGEWLLVEFTVEAGKSELRYLDVIVARDGELFELLAWCEDGDDASMKALEPVVMSLVLGTFEDPGDGGDAAGGTEKPPEKKTPGDETPPGGGSDVRVPNPWEGCGKGSWVKFRLTSEAGDIRQQMDIVQTLVDQDADSYTMKTDTTVDGTTIEGEPQRIPLVQKAGEEAKAETGEETIQVPKGEFACAWRKTSIAGGTTQVWTNKDVPGVVVKTVSEMPGARTVMELAEFERK